MKRLKRFIRHMIQPVNLGELVRSLPEKSKVLDVGCGNHSPTRYKRVNPNIRYYGLDIAEYNLSADDYASAEDIRFVGSNAFDQGISQIGQQFDLIISSHNLEHVDHPVRVLAAMASSLSAGGKLWLSFPSQRSVNLPSRGGCLNFYDDATHKTPIDELDLLNQLRALGLDVLQYKSSYRPVMAYLFGAIQEPFSRFAGRIFSHTWSFWGFETIVIVQMPASTRT
jgi:SAM-dependent methyltransferase